MTIARLNHTSNTVWGEVVVSCNDKECHFPYNLATGEVFNDDMSYLIRAKCTALVFVTPMMTVIRTVYWIAKAVFMTFKEGYRYLECEDSPENAFKKISEVASDSVRAIGYGLLMTGCAAGGIVAPFAFREHYGHFERTLNRHSDGPHKDKFYLAICFQSLIVINSESSNLEAVANKLVRYESRTQAIRDAFWSFSYQKLMEEIGHLQSGT